MRLRELPVLVRAMIGTPPLLLLIAGVQHWLLTTLPASLTWRALALLLPLLFGAAVIATFMVRETGARARALVRALERVAGGDFGAALPSDFGRDVWSLRTTFEKTCRELLRLKEAAASADARRRQLFANLSHELATPMTSILGLLDTLSDQRIRLAEDHRAALYRALEGELLRMTRLVADLRELATIEDPELTLQWHPCDVAALVEEVVGRLELAMPQSPAAITSTTPAIASVDRTRVEQVLVNLLMNAKRHALEGTSVRISVTDERDHVAIAVENDGDVLPEVTLKRLGERFFREDSSRTRATGGLGLGLAIVNAVVERHAGSLSFTRGPSDRGLCVSVRLPKTPRADALADC